MLPWGVVDAALPHKLRKLKENFVIGPQLFVTDKKNSAAIGRVMLGLVLALSALPGCSRTGPEEAIRLRIDAMEAAIEARDASEFLRGVSEDFSGADGAYDRRGLRSLVAAQFLGAERVTLILGPPDISLHGRERATVRISAVVGGGRFLPERVETLEIESGWRIEDGEWVCYTARWARGQETR